MLCGACERCSRPPSLITVHFSGRKKTSNCHQLEVFCVLLANYAASALTLLFKRLLWRAALFL